MLDIFLKGMLLGGSLIIAIGIQNAFVLKQGLTNTHVFATAFTASLIDAILIFAGVLGIGALTTQFPDLLIFMKYGGAVFLFIYGALAFNKARQHGRLDTTSAQTETSLKQTIILLAGFSLLNPHVYLDTVVLIGSISAQHGENGRYWFGAGASLMSFVWFFALAYGGRQLAPLFAKPRAWQILDIIIGLTMWALAASLLF
jgi:L-lysine exporter family protein LysE/ArgO